MRLHFLISTLIMILSANSFAIEPNIGDVAEYRTIYTDENGQVFNSVWQKKVLDMKASGNEWLIQWESESHPPAQEWVLGYVLFYVTDIDVFCQNMNEPPKRAVIEEIKTPAGMFLGCRVHNPDGSLTWYSEEVPFGVVKRVSNFDDGATVEDILIDVERKVTRLRR